MERRTHRDFEGIDEPADAGSLRLCKISGLPPAIDTIFDLLRSPDSIWTSLRATENSLASSFINSTFAAPSTGAAEMRTRNAPACSPMISLREARGTTATEKVSLPLLRLELINLN
jgi:hypothetical protein